MNDHIENLYCAMCAHPITDSASVTEGRLYHEQCDEQPRLLVRGQREWNPLLAENFEKALTRYVQAEAEVVRLHAVYDKVEASCRCSMGCPYHAFEKCDCVLVSTHECECMEASGDCIVAENERDMARAVVMWLGVLRTTT